MHQPANFFGRDKFFGGKDPFDDPFFTEGFGPSFMKGFEDPFFKKGFGPSFLKGFDDPFFTDDFDCSFMKEFDPFFKNSRKNNDNSQSFQNPTPRHKLKKERQYNSPNRRPNRVEKRNDGYSNFNNQLKKCYECFNDAHCLNQ